MASKEICHLVAKTSWWHGTFTTYCGITLPTKDDEAAMDAWAAEQAKRLGADRLPVRRIPAEAAPGDPYTEFVNHAPDPWKVYNVDPDAPDVDPNAGWSE